jgi:C4-dicarboxylate transporter
MKSWVRWLVVTLLVGAVSFLLVPLLPVPANAPQPPAAIFPFFVVLAFFESMALGLGVAFLIFGRPLLTATGVSPRLATAAYLSIAFLLANWWLHDYMHRVTNGDWNRIVLVEYGFHLPLMVAGAVVAWFFVSVAMRSARQVHSERRVLLGAGK